MRQDRQLEGIERGLGTLREVGLAMGEALDHQDVLVDAITEKVCVRQSLIPTLAAHMPPAAEHHWPETGSSSETSVTTCSLMPISWLWNRGIEAIQVRLQAVCCSQVSNIAVSMRRSTT